MKQVFLLTFSFILGGFGITSAQLFVNDGADITVESGATLVVEGGIENKNGGTIDNDGTIEVEGDFVNTATYDGSDPNLVVFSGTEDAQVTSNGAVFDSVRLEKSATKSIILQDDMTVGANGGVNFVNDQNYIDVADANLVMQDGAAFVNADNDNYVVTSGAGYLRYEDVGASETVNYPVGFDVNTYNPAELMTTGSNTSDNYDVRVLEGAYEDGLTGTAITANAVNATWEIVEGTPGGAEADVTLEWNSTDELTDFDRTFSAVTRYDNTAMSWDAEYNDFGSADGSNPYTQTRFGVTEFSPFIVAGGEGAEEFSNALQLELKAFLAGPYSSGSMNDALRDSAFIPGTEPYTGLGYSFQGFGGGEQAGPSAFDDLGSNSVVDWVIVELRDIADSSTVVASAAAFIQSDGDIVDREGNSPLKIFGAPDGDYIVAIDHRNHLLVRSATALSLSSSSSTSYDFSTALAQAYNNPSVDDNPMRSVSGTWVLYGGDANNNGNVRYNLSNNDRNEILTRVGFFTPNAIVNGYYTEDVNLDGSVKYNLSNNDRNVVLTNVGFFTPNNSIETND